MTRSETQPDLLVVGAGIIGLSAAREAAGRGLRVVVVDRGEPGGGASRAAAGMLSPLGEARESGAFLEFGVASLRMYPDWVARLEEETGISLDYVEGGKLRLAFSPPEVDRLAERRRWAEAHRLSAEWVEPDELRAREPAVAPSALAGLLVADDFRLDNRKLATGLAAGAQRAGAELRRTPSVHSVDIDGDRARGVTFADGSAMSAGAVLVAAGAWSGLLDGLPHRLPVRPVRGQMLVLRPDEAPSGCVLESEEIYLVPRTDGRLLVGATVEEVGFERRNTAEGTRRLLGAALHLAPGLATAPLVDLWAGFRPGTFDGNPILGPDPEVRDLFYATGHYRNGILLAPITGRVLGGMVAGDGTFTPPVEFRPGRVLPSPDHTRTI